MRDAWAQIADGVSLIAGAAAALLRGPERAGANTDTSPAGVDAPMPGGPQAPVSSQTAHDPFLALAAALRARGVSADSLEALWRDAKDPAFGVDAEKAAEEPSTDAPAPEESEPIRPALVAVPLQPCMEVDRQARERGRREALAADPLNALEVAAYYTCYLRTQPAKAEEWVRCIEAIPGSAPDRLAQAFAQGGIPGWQTYAERVDEVRRDVEVAKAVTAKLRMEQPDLAGDWLDADREGRIWFWLGDRPDVEALAPTPTVAPSSEVPVNGDPRGFMRQIQPDTGTPLRIHPLRPAEVIDATDAEDDGATLAGQELLATAIPEARS